MKLNLWNIRATETPLLIPARAAVVLALFAVAAHADFTTCTVPNSVTPNMIPTGCTLIAHGPAGPLTEFDGVNDLSSNSNNVVINSFAVTNLTSTGTGVYSATFDISGTDTIGATTNPFTSETTGTIDTFAYPFITPGGTEYSVGDPTYNFTLTMTDLISGIGTISTSATSGGLEYASDNGDGTYSATTALEMYFQLTMDGGASQVAANQNATTGTAFEFATPDAPEPDSILLIGSGLIALGLISRRLRARRTAA